MYNFLKQFLTWSIRVLIALSTLVFLYTLFFEAFTYNIDCSPIGVKFFFSLFNSYSNFLILTFTTIGIYLILDQIDISTLPKDIRKISDWKDRLNNKIANIELTNPFMFSYIKRNSDKIYEYLAKNKLRISNKKQLKLFFEEFLEDEIENFEKTSQKFYKNEGKYININISYSYIDFTDFRDYLIEPDFHYYKFMQHFREMYMQKVKEFNKDKIKKLDKG